MEELTYLLIGFLPIFVYVLFEGRKWRKQELQIVNLMLKNEELTRERELQSSLVERPTAAEKLAFGTSPKLRALIKSISTIDILVLIVVVTLVSGFSFGEMSERFSAAKRAVESVLGVVPNIKGGATDSGGGAGDKAITAVGTDTGSSGGTGDSGAVTGARQNRDVLPGVGGGTRNAGKGRTPDAGGGGAGDGVGRDREGTADVGGSAGDRAGGSASTSGGGDAGEGAGKSDSGAGAGDRQSP